MWDLVSFVVPCPSPHPPCFPLDSLFSWTEFPFLTLGTFGHLFILSFFLLAVALDSSLPIHYTLDTLSLFLLTTHRHLVDSGQSSPVGTRVPVVC